MSSNTCTHDYKSDYFTLLALDASFVSVTLHLRSLMWNNMARTGFSRFTFHTERMVLTFTKNDTWRNASFVFFFRFTGFLIPFSSCYLVCLVCLRTPFNVRGQFVIFWCCLYIQSHNSGILQPLFIFRCSHL